METPTKIVLSILLFWLVLGGLFRLFNVDNYMEGNQIEEQQTGGFEFLYNLFTFKVNGINEQLRWSMTIFFSAALGISIYVLIRSGN